MSSPKQSSDRSALSRLFLGRGDTTPPAHPMAVFSLSSVRVYVERGVLVWVALAVVFCAAAAYIESWTLIGWGAGAAIGAGWLVSFFGAGIIHELGHVLVLRHYGLRTTWAQIGLTGAAVHTPGSLGPPELVWVFMAGPVANLVAGAPVALIMIFAVGSSPPLALGFVAWSWIVIHLGLFVFNLVPAGVTDGAQAFRAARGTGKAPSPGGAEVVL